MSLEQDLINTLGRENCLFEKEDRLPYSFDAGKQGKIPVAVVFPEVTAQVSAVMAYAFEHGVSVVPRGAGSGLTGGSIPGDQAIVVDLERMNRIIEIDTENLCAVVEPGVITADLQAAAAKADLFYPPDPASFQVSTIGGNIAENAGGLRAVKYGVTKAYVLGLEVVLASGKIITLGSKCIKDVTGYSMTELFVGSEGTLGIVTRATLKLLPMPETVRTMRTCFANIFAAGQAVPKILKSGVIPCTLEFIDQICLDALEKQGSDLDLPKGTTAMLLIEVDGTDQDTQRDVTIVKKVLKDSGILDFIVAEDEAERERLWNARRSIHGALGPLGVIWMSEDISVPTASIPDMLKRMTELAGRENLIIPCFGHYGDGNIHLSVIGKTRPPSKELVLSIKKEIFSHTVELGGRIAAEHGIGTAKKEYLDINLDPDTLALALSIKKMLDPKGILNPGKVFPGKAIASSK